MTTVLVVDDQSLIRQAVADILGHEPGISVVGEAVNGQEAVTLAASILPDVVLMDIRMPVLDGIEATRAICADTSLAATRVLILTTFEEDEYLVAALRAGASGFIGKGAEPEEIARSVRAVHAGDSLLSPAATRTLITKYVLPPARSMAWNKFSERDAAKLRAKEIRLGAVSGAALAGTPSSTSTMCSSNHVARFCTPIGSDSNKRDGPVMRRRSGLAPTILKLASLKSEPT